MKASLWPYEGKPLALIPQSYPASELASVFIPENSPALIDRRRYNGLLARTLEWMSARARDLWGVNPVDFLDAVLLPVGVDLWLTPGEPPERLGRFLAEGLAGSAVADLLEFPLKKADASREKALLLAEADFRDWVTSFRALLVGTVRL